MVTAAIRSRLSRPGSQRDDLWPEMLKSKPRDGGLCGSCSVAMNAHISAASWCDSATCGAAVALAPRQRCCAYEMDSKWFTCPAQTRNQDDARDVQRARCSTGGGSRACGCAQAEARMGPTDRDCPFCHRCRRRGILVRDERES